MAIFYMSIRWDEGFNHLTNLTAWIESDITDGNEEARSNTGDVIIQQHISYKTHQIRKKNKVSLIMIIQISRYINGFEACHRNAYTFTDHHVKQSKMWIGGSRSQQSIALEWFISTTCPFPCSISCTTVSQKATKKTTVKRNQQHVTSHLTILPAVSKVLR